MAYLSPQIEALVKKKQTKTLINPLNSCGIFQDYGNYETEEQSEE